MVIFSYIDSQIKSRSCNL